MPGMRRFTGAHGRQRSDLPPLGRELTRRTLCAAPEGLGIIAWALCATYGASANGTDASSSCASKSVPNC